MDFTSSLSIPITERATLWIEFEEITPGEGTGPDQYTNITYPLAMYLKITPEFFMVDLKGGDSVGYKTSLIRRFTIRGH